MKMPEKHDLLGRHSRGSEQGIGAILAFAMAKFLRQIENLQRFTKMVIDATMCAIIA